MAEGVCACLSSWMPTAVSPFLNLVRPSPRTFRESDCYGPPPWIEGVTTTSRSCMRCPSPLPLQPVTAFRKIVHLFWFVPHWQTMLLRHTYMLLEVRTNILTHCKRAGSLNVSLDQKKMTVVIPFCEFGCGERTAGLSDRKMFFSEGSGSSGSAKKNAVFFSQTALFLRMKT